MNRNEDAMKFMENRQKILQEVAVLKSKSVEDIREVNRVFEIYHVLLMNRDKIPKVEKLLGISSG